MVVKKKPKFQRQNAHRKKRVAKKGWRRPRGMDSKQRAGKRHQPKRPRIGYGTGVKNTDILVHNVNEINSLEKGTKVKIAASVGKKKSNEIIEAAEKKDVIILNRG